VFSRLGVDGWASEREPACPAAPPGAQVTRTGVRRSTCMSAPDSQGRDVGTRGRHLATRADERPSLCRDRRTQPYGSAGLRRVSRSGSRCDPWREGSRWPDRARSSSARIHRSWRLPPTGWARPALRWCARSGAPVWPRSDCSMPYTLRRPYGYGQTETSSDGASWPACSTAIRPQNAGAFLTDSASSRKRSSKNSSVTSWRDHRWLPPRLHGVVARVENLPNRRRLTCRAPPEVLRFPTPGSLICSVQLRPDAQQKPVHLLN